MTSVSTLSPCDDERDALDLHLITSGWTSSPATAAAAATHAFARYTPASDNRPGIAVPRAGGFRLVLAQNWATDHPTPDCPPTRAQTNATGRAHPALAFSTLTGKHATLKPCARGSAPRFTSFSIWQYSRSSPAKCASQMLRARRPSARTRPPCPELAVEAVRVDADHLDSLLAQPERGRARHARLLEVLGRSEELASRPVQIITMSNGLSV